jgi:hypothetical protein
MADVIPVLVLRASYLFKYNAQWHNACPSGYLLPITAKLNHLTYLLMLTRKYSRVLLQYPVVSDDASIFYRVKLQQQFMMHFTSNFES